MVDEFFGHLFVAPTALDGPLELWRNVSPAPRHWLAVRTVGTKANRDGMGAKIKVVTVTGLLLALPVLLWEFWSFIVPGLNPRERKFAIPFVVSSVILFGLGAWFGLVTLPRALNFLLGFAGTGGVVLVMSVGRYISFVTLVIGAFGLSFEFPLLLVSLMAVGVLSSRQLRQWRRYAVVGIAIFAAVITPSQDWFTMTAMMVPLLIFYELAILVGRFLMKK